MAKKAQEEAVVITAVRFKRNAIRIEWKQGIDDCGRTFHENPRKSFDKAIKALGAHVVTLCEFSAKDEDKIEATGITVTNKGDNDHALIVAKKKIKKAGRVFNIATPLLPMYADAEAKGSDHMTDAEAAAIEKVIAEAKKYLGGDREQGIIEWSDPDAPKKTKEDPKQEEFPSEAGAEQ